MTLRFAGSEILLLSQANWRRRSKDSAEVDIKPFRKKIKDNLCRDNPAGHPSELCFPLVSFTHPKDFPLPSQVVQMFFHHGALEKIPYLLFGKLQA